MKYLARALGDASAAARPMTRSRSPLAEADQRLHLDGLAAAYQVGVGMLQDVAAEPTPEIDAEQVDPGSSPSASGVVFGAVGAREPASSLGTPSRSPVPTSRAEVAPKRRGVPLRVGSPVVAPGTTTESATAPSPGPSHGPQTGLPTTITVPSVGPASHDPEPALPGVPRPPAESSDSVPAAPSASTSAEPSLGRALAQVAAWLERPTTPARPKARPAEPVERDPLRSSASAAAARASVPESAVAPTSAPAPARLEIGSIEVDLVPPAPRPGRGRPESRRSESSWSPSRPFGWRQS